MKSPYVAIKISQMCKTPDVQLDDTISYINSDQTPGKSILKKSEELVDKEIRVKSAHKVNFDDQVALNEVPLDEEMQTKLNLSAALSRIENLDLDELSPQEYINAERKLDFETEDFDSSDDNIDSNARSFNDTTFSISDKESSPGDLKIISRKEFNIPINILPATPLQTNIETSITSETISNMTDMENHDSGIRILRSRTIMTNNT
ncbi:disks large-associated protein 5, partial [Lasius niger]